MALTAAIIGTVAAIGSATASGIQNHQAQKQQRSAARATAEALENANKPKPVTIEKQVGSDSTLEKQSRRMSLDKTTISSSVTPFGKKTLG